MSWDVRLWDDVESWVLGLDDESYDLVASAIERRAVLLIAGDKAGQWKQWYAEHIPIADDRFDQWLENEEE